MSIYTPNKTSARLLVDFASQKWHRDDSNDDHEKIFLIIYDLYIKARSYAIINKITFWLAILAGLMILIWPSLAIITKDFGFEKDFLKSAIVQTTVTGIAALMFAVYSHYKKRQMHVENLMRSIIYTNEINPPLVQNILKEMERIDSGFQFNDAIAAKNTSPSSKKP